MLNRRALLVLALVVLLAGFGYGLLQLFQLRFAAGDVYPHYSSLRADPLGCKIYYDSLAQLTAARVHRHMGDINKLPDGRDTTLFIFGLPWNELDADPDEFKTLDAFVRNGGRIVVTIHPELGLPRGFSSALMTNRATFKNPLRQSENEMERDSVKLGQKWGFSLGYIPTSRDGRLFAPVATTLLSTASLPTNLLWRSALVITNLDLSWRVLYARGTDPVMVERTIGQGSIVLATDSFFTSNEAMQKERHTDLLSWLAGPSREILFDETHLGVHEQPGLATLARRYKLHGGVLALLALAALFLWKNSVSFAPRDRDSSLTAPVTGRESAAGFVNLLRRSIAPKDLLQTSLNEWHKSTRLDGRSTAPRREKIRAVVETYNAAEKPNVVEAYREIADILNRKK